MAGRKPLPARVAAAQNDVTKLTQEELNNRMENEPKPPSFKLRCPVWLSDEAKKEWARLVALFKAMDKEIISDLDINPLAIYCEAVATYKNAMQEAHKLATLLEKDAETSEDDAENTKKSEENSAKKRAALLKEAYDAAAQIKKLGEVLCLDPVSRARVGVRKAKTKNNTDPNGELFD